MQTTTETNGKSCLFSLLNFLILYFALRSLSRIEYGLATPVDNIVCLGGLVYVVAMVIWSSVLTEKEAKKRRR